MNQTPAENLYWVYIVTDRPRLRFKTGVTSHLLWRMEKLEDSACNILIYYEAFRNPVDCVQREARFSGYSKRKLKKMIEIRNPDMHNLLTDLNHAESVKPG